MAVELTEPIYQLQQVAVAVTTGNLEHVYAESMKSLRIIIGAEVGSLQLLDEGGGGLRFAATLIPEELPRLQKYDPIPIDEGSISGFVIKHGETVFFSDSWQDPEFGERQRKIAQEANVGNRSFICVPLKVRGRTVGVLSVLHREPHTFTEGDKNLTVALASFIAMAVDQARFEERLRQVATAVSSLDLNCVYDESMTALRALLGAEVGSLQLLDEDGSGLRFVATLIPEELPRLQKYDPIAIDEESISGFVIKHGEPKFFSDSWQDPDFGERQRKIAQEADVGNRSFICVPLVVKEDIIGVLSVLHREPNRFSAEDLRRSTILAAFIAIAAQNARYMRELLAVHRRQQNIERAATMADVANNFVHTINNDLGLIRLYVKQLERRRDAGRLDDEDLWRKLSSIGEVATKTTDLVAGFKEFERIKKAEYVSVQECVDRAVQNLRLSLEDIKVIAEFAPEPVRVYATQQLTDVFENLIRNSRDAMQNSPERKVVIAPEQVLKNRLRVSVTDTGPGLPSELKGRLFQLGATTKQASLGGGYGLWWVRTWLHRIGGDIRHDDSYNNGARFVIDLPTEPLESAL